MESIKTRAVRFHQFGGPEVLRIEPVEGRQPGVNEVSIRVKALGLNRAEALLRTDRYIESPQFPSGLGLEATGVVEAVGSAVRGFAPGDAVSILPPTSMQQDPTHAERLVVPQARLVKNPPGQAWSDAAATWMQYLTAYGALIQVAGLREGDFVVITAASSSVGLAAIQIARRAGAVPIAVTRTSAKREALLQAGAAEVIASEEENLRSRLLDISGKAGVRVVFDPVGGPIFEPLTAAMAEGGILIEYGGLSPEPTPFPLFEVLSRSLVLRGYRVYEVLEDPLRLQEAEDYILAGLADGSLRPVIARTFAFDEIVEAYRYLESNQQFGKVVVTL
ncbi:zinc-dependent alcohol dehydrogenase family protein [Pseudomonas nitroreducens]|uniref:zinc-dependent alcohol dehydrogenase family protein n=1 Tax=Pseudomonas nitroreducens TaxID=46680 RepID=UPI00147642C0|nr:zinc-dependent alcohol dehydrogenase family protein [Pseudomonas nitroreducens]MDG9857830.1 zinc-dependent alcohol dehydrogenase family protein [Pseudomonas nitroreducens]MDH1076186.1 zinc-dependent alcohol dehydrogenase family protein [Pseudomonas nitroreducens]NMZ73558.1 zinc-dependent alcohol dehydrogenase family protein [Pseudomonas nitroreducens]